MREQIKWEKISPLTIEGSVFTLNKRDINDLNYWVEEFKEQDMLYMNYKNCYEHDGSDQNLSSPAFAKYFEQIVEDSSVSRLIVDLRENTGGNSFFNYPILKSVIKKQDKFNHIFVLIGRYTFSAAAHFIFQLQQYTEPIFIGEPSGSSASFYSDPELITLEHSQLPFRLSTSHWKMSHAFDDRITLNPHIVMEETFEEYMSGEDKILDLAINFTEDHFNLIDELESDKGNEEFKQILVKAEQGVIHNILHPTDFAILKNMTNTLLKENKGENAIALAIFLSERFESSNSLNLLAEVYTKTNQKSKAMETYVNSTSLYKNSKEAAYKLEQIKRTIEQ